MTDDTERLLRAGEYLHRRARELGWPDDGEGAFNYIVRKTYELALEDAQRAPKRASNDGFDLARIGDAIAMAVHLEFRQSGWTREAINHPLNDAQVAVRCGRNGIPVDKAPRTWRYAPNALVAAELQRAADRNTLEYCREETN